jgi:hypothetical protein
MVSFGYDVSNSRCAGCRAENDGTAGGERERERESGGRAGIIEVGTAGIVQGVLNDALGALLGGERDFLASGGEGAGTAVRRQGAGISARAGDDGRSGGKGTVRNERSRRLDCIIKIDHHVSSCSSFRDPMATGTRPMLSLNGRMGVDFAHLARPSRPLTASTEASCPVRKAERRLASFAGRDKERDG